MLRLYGYRIFAGEVEKQIQDTRSTGRHQDAELAQHGRRAFREGAGKFRASEAQRVQEDGKKDADEGFPMEKKKGNRKRRKCGRARWNGWKQEREGGCSCETSRGFLLAGEEKSCRKQSRDAVIESTNDSKVFFLDKMPKEKREEEVS